MRRVCASVIKLRLSLKPNLRLRLDEEVKGVSLFLQNSTTPGGEFLHKPPTPSPLSCDPDATTQKFRARQQCFSLKNDLMTHLHMSSTSHQ